MNPKTIGFALATTALLSSLTPGQDANPGRVPPTVVTIEQLQLGGDWRGHHGIHMTFKDTEVKGTCEILVSKYRKGKPESLFKGEIKILCAARTNSSLRTPFIAEITIDKEKSVVLGCTSDGEGDPGGLYFYQLDNSFGHKLKKNFDLKYDLDRITLESKCTNGEWGKYLDDVLPTVIATANLPAKTDEQRPLYEDKEFKIVVVGYGHAGDDPPRTPGVYVQSKKHQKWIRVEKVSLTDSVLGRSPTLVECREVGKNPPAVGWNFNPLADQDYIEFPLKTSGSLLWPDKIERSDEKGRLILSFNSGWKIAGVETVLIVSLADLRKCLDEGFPRNQ